MRGAQVSTTVHIVDASYAKRPLDHVKPSDRWIMFRAKDSERWISLSGIHQQAQDAISARQLPETTDPPSPSSTARRAKEKKP